MATITIESSDEKAAEKEFLLSRLQTLAAAGSLSPIDVLVRQARIACLKDIDFYHLEPDWDFTRFSTR